jgi:hypothetical protein
MRRTFRLSKGSARILLAHVMSAIPCKDLVKCLCTDSAILMSLAKYGDQALELLSSSDLEVVNPLQTVFYCHD